MSGSPDLALLAGDVLDVAPRLLGASLTHAGVTVRLTEVEAYAGSDDPGSHAYRGPTPRTRVMFGPPGHLYAYFSYGMHVCANVVTGREGTASAVLLRAGEVVDGVDLARERRATTRERDLARGPANLCRALGIGLDLDGTDLSRGPVRLVLAAAPDPGRVSTGPRVGLRGAPDRPWRFWLTGEPTVSAYRPAAKRR
ncbi:DNA-3-methyladenine glycosylase [Nocardioides sp. REDSEA-S30_B4]|uniref:DNA-3-methyladenine glycosylase n=1 Tax=Nocardioides sp. REDSEA-S30_B4 TaxID=1811552 RepID=UPI000AFECD24|nr:DNA-3-methyladenine glycosylase [Nocardioides sp. REDSEA-S30_B4]